MKNVAPKPCALSRGAATAMCDRLESSNVSTTSLSGIGSSARVGGVAAIAEASPRKSGRIRRLLERNRAFMLGKLHVGPYRRGSSEVRIEGPRESGRGASKSGALPRDAYIHMSVRLSHGTSS